MPGRVRRQKGLTLQEEYVWVPRRDRVVLAGACGMAFGFSTAPSDGCNQSFAWSPLLKVTRGGKRGSAWVLVAMLAVATGAGCAGSPSIAN